MSIKKIIIFESQLNQLEEEEEEEEERNEEPKNNLNPQQKTTA
jgi:hypothetical protein